MSSGKDQFRFDDRVAVVTGSGRGLGRSYAKLLASRGAKVVINDTGASLEGEGLDAGPAEEVAEEITAAGGEAIACTASVATRDGATAIIEAALDSWGRVDILIHNAANARSGLLHDIAAEDFEAVLDVHLRGGFHVVQSAYRIMREAGYGRVVLASSVAGLYGTEFIVPYTVAKAGLLGLSNVIAREGAAHGVNSNCILPGAVTRMAPAMDGVEYPPTTTPETVAPAVAWLCHEACSITGEIVIAMSGRLARAYVAETPGVFREQWTIEDVAQHIDEARTSDQPWQLSTLTGFEEHLARGFAMNPR